jgi:hypothetical protein
MARGSSLARERRPAKRFGGGGAGGERPIDVTFRGEMESLP